MRLASGNRPSSCICPLIYTLQNKADLQESKDSVSSGWAVCSLPQPLPLILRNNRGCSHLPKTPSLGRERRKAVSWLNKAETPVCQKHTDVRQAQNHGQSICPAHCTHTRVVWVGDQLGWETHTRGKDWPQFSIPLQFSFSHFPLTDALRKYHPELPKTILGSKAYGRQLR